MSNIPDDINKLRLYLDNLKKQSQEIPKLQRVLEISELNWQLEQAYPGSSSPLNLQSGSINKGLILFSNSVGEVEPYTASFAEDSFTSAMSGATGSFDNIRKFSPTNQEQSEWQVNSFKSYETHIRRWDSSELTKRFLVDVQANDLYLEFEEMLTMRDSYQAGQVDHSSFGIKIRNVLEHFKGLIKKAAQISLGEKPSKRDLSWPKIGSAIISNPSSVSQKGSFKELGDSWISVHSDLSGILKKDVYTDQDNLIQMCDQVILLLESFSDIISKDKIKNAT